MFGSKSSKNGHFSINKVCKMMNKIFFQQNMKCPQHMVSTYISNFGTKSHSQGTSRWTWPPPGNKLGLLRAYGTFWSEFFSQAMLMHIPTCANMCFCPATKIFFKNPDYHTSTKIQGLLLCFWS